MLVLSHVIYQGVERQNAHVRSTQVQLDDQLQEVRNLHIARHQQDFLGP